MNADIHLEHRASSSQGKHEGEPSLGLCDRLNRTRDNSQRQLPTDHDYAVSTREYQTDQSSLKTAPTAARSVFGKGQKQRQQQPHCCAELTRSLHIRPSRSLNSLKQTLGIDRYCSRDSDCLVHPSKAFLASSTASGSSYITIRHSSSCLAKTRPHWAIISQIRS